MKKIIVFLFATTTIMAVAQHGETTPRNNHDPIFPRKGKFQAGMMTTYTGRIPPPVLIGDVTYGVSNKFSVGITGGTIGTLALYGIKVNLALVQRKDFRISFRMTSVYYPERDGKFLFDKEDKYIMPWMLSMGFFDAEWKTKKNIRWAIGVGVAETHCIKDMKMWFMSSKKHHQHGDCKEMSPSLIHVFGTMQGSVSIPISKRFTLKPEVVFVFNENGLIKRGEFKVVPINPYISVVYSF